MFDTPLAALMRTRPTWFAKASWDGRRVVGAAGPADTSWSTAPLQLHLTEVRERLVNVRETGGRLPAYCPESHLNDDGGFCVGLEPVVVVDDTAAAQWWADLHVFLRLQSVAERTGVWPQGSGLDHGLAGEWHQTALRLAAELGLDEEYARAAANEPSWITNPQLSLIDEPGAAINMRMRCPCGCRDRSGRPRTRRRCRRLPQVAQLIVAERERRRCSELFWTAARAHGRVCCGRMRDCSLR